jgi:putative ABC transport system ATP-binding protein
MKQPLVKIESLRKTYRTETIQTLALAEISLELAEGEFVSLLGPSGSGKSTLLSVMGLLEDWEAGEYWLCGEPMRRASRQRWSWHRNRTIGFVFQAYNLISDLTLVENVELPLRYRGEPRGLARRRALQALEQLGLAARAEHYPRQISGGQQQRAAIARAVLNRPRLLLADEPTGNLDSTNAVAVLDLLSELHREGSTVVMVTHDASYAARAQRILRMQDGQLQSAGLAAAA